MGAFGPTDGFWAKVFNPIFFWFRTLHRRYCLLLRLYTAHQRAAQLRLRCLGYPRYDPRRRPLQGPAQPWLYGGKKDGTAEYKTPHINFIGNRKKFYTFSCALIAIVLVFCAVFGVKMDVEFKGGSMVTLSYEGDVDLPSLKSEIGSQLGQSDLTLQTGSDISGNQTLTVTLPGSQTLTTEQLDDMLTAINEAHP